MDEHKILGVVAALFFTAWGFLELRFILDALCRRFYGTSFRQTVKLKKRQFQAWLHDALRGR